jgi:hypothetical protein
MRPSKVSVVFRHCALTCLNAQCDPLSTGTNIGAVGVALCSDSAVN